MKRRPADPALRLDVARVAKLARIELREEEARRLEGELARILDYVRQLGELEPPEDVPEPGGSAVCPVRDDVPAPVQPIERTRSNAPVLRDGLFIVPRILE